MAGSSGERNRQIRHVEKAKERQAAEMREEFGFPGILRGKREFQFYSENDSLLDIDRLPRGDALEARIE